MFLQLFSCTVCVIKGRKNEAAWISGIDVLTQGRLNEESKVIVLVQNPGALPL